MGHSSTRSDASATNVYLPAGMNLGADTLQVTIYETATFLKLIAFSRRVLGGLLRAGLAQNTLHSSHIVYAVFPQVRLHLFIYRQRTKGPAMRCDTKPVYASGPP